MKRTLIYLGCFIASACLFSCDEEKADLAPTVQYIELSELKKTMSVGETSQLTATVLPDAVVDKTVTWKSGDESIVVIDGEGNLTAVAEGETKISAIVNNVTALCALTVVPVAVESVALNETAKKMSVNETLQLTATVLPPRLEGKAVSWSTDADDIVTVEVSPENSCIATVKGVGIGIATITATVEGETTSCKVTVLAPKEEVTGGNTVTMNLSLYETVDEVAAKIKELDGRGVTVYNFYGDFAKLGDWDVKNNHNNNPFAETGVTEIDFTGIGSWPEVTVETSDGNVTMEGMPHHIFYNLSQKFSKLKRVVLPESCKVFGTQCFRATNIETLIAPGVEILGGQFLYEAKSLTELHLTTEEKFKSASTAFNKFPAANSQKCTLYLNRNKESEVTKKQYFDRTWKDVIFTE